jgi:hypothetical protein
MDFIFIIQFQILGSVFLNATDSSETLYMKALLTTVTQSLDKQMCVECQMHNSRSASLSNLFFHLK